MIDGAHRGFIGPRGSGPQFGRLPLRDKGTSPGRIGARPSAIVFAVLLNFLGSPFSEICALVFSILSVPLSMMGRARLPKFRRSEIGAAATRIRQAIARCSPQMKLGDRFATLATVANLHRACSMCWSRIRRTSSAMEMPSFFASRCKKRRCGSVNEIICLVIPIRIPRGIQWRQVDGVDPETFAEAVIETMGGPRAPGRASRRSKPGRLWPSLRATGTSGPEDSPRDGVPGADGLGWRSHSGHDGERTFTIKAVRANTPRHSEVCLGRPLDREYVEPGKTYSCSDRHR